MLVNLVANSGLTRVSTGGAIAFQIPPSRVDGENSLRWPSFLPDGRHFLTVARNLTDQKRGVFLGTLDREIRTKWVRA